MAIEKTVELKDGSTITFEFNRDNVMKFEQFGGKLSDGINNVMSNLHLYIKTCVKGGYMSDSKAKKILDEIAEEYDIVDFYATIAGLHADVFTGGENAAPKKKLSEMK